MIFLEHGQEVFVITSEELQDVRVCVKAVPGEDVECLGIFFEHSLKQALCGPDFILPWEHGLNIHGQGKRSPR